MKALQKFTDDYLTQCAEMSYDEIAQFLDDFRKVHGGQRQIQNQPPTQAIKSPSKLISMKVPQDLLSVFRTKAALTSTPYQTQIKKLMLDWVK